MLIAIEPVGAERRGVGGQRIEDLRRGGWRDPSKRILGRVGLGLAPVGQVVALAGDLVPFIGDAVPLVGES